eukprot:2545196-Pleurochrysis_carterae.AAC.4
MRSAAGSRRRATRSPSRRSASHRMQRLRLRGLRCRLDAGLWRLCRFSLCGAWGSRGANACCRKVGTLLSCCSRLRYGSCPPYLVSGVEGCRVCCGCGAIRSRLGGLGLAHLLGNVSYAALRLVEFDVAADLARFEVTQHLADVARVTAKLPAAPFITSLTSSNLVGALADATYDRAQLYRDQCVTQLGVRRKQA